MAGLHGGKRHRVPNIGAYRRTPQNRNDRLPSVPQSHPPAQYGVNASWLSETIRECQSFLGESVSLVPSDLRASAGRFIARLPKVRTPLETLMQKGLLLDLAIQFGYAAH